MSDLPVPPTGNFEAGKSIRSLYPLLGASLAVVEGLLGYWLYRAETSREMTAGA